MHRLRGKLSNFKWEFNHGLNTCNEEIPARRLVARNDGETPHKKQGGPEGASLFFLLNTVWLDTLLFTQGVAVASCVYLAFEWATVCNHESSSTDCPASKIAQLTSDSGCGMLFMSPC